MTSDDDSLHGGKHKRKGRRSAPELFGCYLATGAEASPPSSGGLSDLELVKATVAAASPTLNRAKRRTPIFSPSLPTFAAMSSAMLIVLSFITAFPTHHTPHHNSS